MRSLFLILILSLAGCTNTPEPIAPVIDTDTIAGYWTGKAAGKLALEHSLQLIPLSWTDSFASRRNPALFEGVTSSELPGDHGAGR